MIYQLPANSRSSSPTPRASYLTHTTGHATPLTPSRPRKASSVSNPRSQGTSRETSPSRSVKSSGYGEWWLFWSGKGDHAQYHVRAIIQHKSLYPVTISIFDLITRCCIIFVIYGSWPLIVIYGIWLRDTTCITLTNYFLYK